MSDLLEELRQHVAQLDRSRSLLDLARQPVAKTLRALVPVLIDLETESENARKADLLDESTGGQSWTLRAKLARIAEIIESVDNRAMATDGPVTPTMQEMKQSEMSEIYKLAGGKPGGG